MDLRRYLQALRKFWWVIAIPTVLGGVLGAYATSTAVPEYQGSVTFFVKTLQDSTPNAAFQGDQFAQRRVNSYVALLSTERFAEAVIENTGVGLTPKQVSKMMGATGDVNTVLLTATVTSDSRAQAALISDAMAIEFVKLVDALENAGDGPGAVNLDVVSGPRVIEILPRKALTIGVRIAAGMLIGLVLALLLELRDTSVRTDDQLLAAGAGPLLARIPFDRRADAAPLVMQTDAQSIRAEAFRQLRTSLQFIDVERPIQVLVITSSVADEGKSATSANLALAVVASNRRVLVIEADFRRPRLADYFGVERAVGLSDVLAGRAEIADVIQPWGASGLDILPSGQLPPNPSELLGSTSMARLLDQFRGHYDLVIIDTPPLLPVTDAAVAATLADGAIVVVRHGRTTRRQLGVSVRSLESVGARFLGAALTMVPSGRGSGYEAYRYETQDAKGSAKAKKSKSAGSGQLEPTNSATTDARSPDVTVD